MHFMPHNLVEVLQVHPVEVPPVPFLVEVLEVLVPFRVEVPLVPFLASPLSLERYRPRPSAEPQPAPGSSAAAAESKPAPGSSVAAAAPGWPAVSTKPGSAQR